MAGVNLVISIGILVGTIFLQIFLSKKESKWLGLILPGISFVFSLVAVLSLAAFPSMSAGENFGIIFITFLLSNIPTLVLLGIYLGYREKKKSNSQLKKMNIQDLD